MRGRVAVAQFVRFFFSSRRRHTRLQGDWSSDVCSSDLPSKETYIPIDVDFRETKGVILFGVNCSGKSSLMKSIGMNLVLAQMGMYVAANTKIGRASCRERV